MEEQKIDLNEIVTVEQLPKIKETLGVISDEIEREIETALSLECTDESKTTIKAYRANLNKIKSALEERRKFVKEQIMKPYQEFEEVYNDLIKNKLTEADKTLKSRIDEIENAQKEEKTVKLLEFATEWVEFYDLKGVIDPLLFVPNVTLSASEKSLKEQIKAQIERVANEIALIREEQYPEEVLSRYLGNDFDYAKARLDTINYHKEIEKLKTKSVMVDNTTEVLDSTVVVEDEEITAPVEIVEPDQNLEECTFTVWASKDDLIKIRNFLKELGVKYE